MEEEDLDKNEEVTIVLKGLQQVKKSWFFAEEKALE